MTAVLTYVYCLVRSTRMPSLGRAPRGMPGGGPVRLVPVPALTVSTGEDRAAARHWLAVSSVSERIYGKTALDRDLQRLDWIGPRALAHEAVVEHFLSAVAVLPMQLFTLFMSDARAVEHVVGDRRRIGRILARIERQVEWGLRLTWDSAGDGGPYREPASGGGAGRAAAARGTLSGADYLTRKRDLRDRARLELQRARTEAERLYRAAAGEATGARRRRDFERAAPGSRLLLDAAFLVPARRAGAFRATVRQHARSLQRSGVSVSMTGPWPAYHFV